MKYYLTYSLFELLLIIIKNEIFYNFCEQFVSSIRNKK
jgi:hypothetical protein